MKMLRVLLVLSLICGFTHHAKADDFQMIVVDPPPPNGPYSVNPVNSTNFTFSFLPCQQGQVPGDTNGTYVGCFTGQNDTRTRFTSLTITVANNIPGQTAGCGPSGITDPNTGNAADLFTNNTCGSNPNGMGYILNFASGGIGVAQIFTIAEQGADPALFGVMSASATTANATTATPEPGSFVLLSTGLVSACSLVRRRIRPSRF